MSKRTWETSLSRYFLPHHIKLIKRADSTHTIRRSHMMKTGSITEYTPTYRENQPKKGQL